MADVQPLRALHYDLARVGSLADVAAPPYDVIDPEQRAKAGRALALQRRARRPARGRAGGDPYAQAASDLRAAGSRKAPSSATTSPRCGRSPRTTRAPTAARSPATASSRACASRTTARAASARTSARTRAPRRTGCRLTRATKANLSPIFCLYDDPEPAPTAAVLQAAEPFGEQTDDDGTVNRLGASTDPAAIEAVQAALAPTPSCSSPTATTATRPRASTPTRSAARASTATCSCAWSRCRTRA